MTTIKASTYDALCFDVYGTILDWEPDIAEFLLSWTSKSGLAMSTQDLLAVYDGLRQPIQNERPALRYPKVLKRTLDSMAAKLGVPIEPASRQAFSHIAETHRPFDDSVQALSDLRGMGFKLAALSNIDERSFSLATASAGIGFDLVVTADRVGAYKPDHAHFWAALSDLRAMGIPKERVLHVAQSRRADIVAANAIGIASIWINRAGHVFGRSGRGAEDAKPDYEADSLSAVVKMLR